MPDPITVQIFNQSFRISTDLENAEYIKKAAAYLDQKMQEAATHGTRRPLHVAVLAGMNIAEEVLEGRGKKEGLLNEADERISNFTKLLDDQADSQGSDDPEFPSDTSTRRF